jgi:hypothetical protein
MGDVSVLNDHENDEGDRSDLSEAKKQGEKAQRKLKAAVESVQQLKALIPTLLEDADSARSKVLQQAGKVIEDLGESAELLNKQLQKFLETLDLFQADATIVSLDTDASDWIEDRGIDLYNEYHELVDSLNTVYQRLADNFNELYAAIEQP